MLQEFKGARRVGTPLIGISSFDPEATMQSITKSLKSGIPIVQWDLIRGWRARTSAGQDAIKQALGKHDILQTLNPTFALEQAVEFPEETILFMINCHLHFSKPDVVQAIWNLRDEFKAKLCTLVILAPTISLPTELQQDIYLLDEPLPNEEELRDIITETIEQAGVTIEEDIIPKAVDALRGISAFPAEQATAMSISKEGLDLSGLWERKHQLIDATPGLSVWRGTEKFAQIGGVHQVKEFMTKIVNGKEAPRVVVFIDEIEKMMAGATSGHDTTGVSQDQLGMLLAEMENKQYSGSIFIGPPGAAKSAIAKALGNEAGVPTISFDLGGMKDSLVGSSENRIRQALKVVDAVGGGQAIFIATCNKLTSLPPELKRRFTMGTFFFDLPTKEERELIWTLYVGKYGLDYDNNNIEAIDYDEGWTGAEIKQCCLLAYRLDITLTEAAKFIVPVYKSAHQEIETLREQASGKFLSASNKGIYSFEKDLVGAKPTRRRFAK